MTWLLPPHSQIPTTSHESSRHFVGVRSQPLNSMQLYTSPYDAHPLVDAARGVVLHHPGYHSQSLRLKRDHDRLMASARARQQLQQQEQQFQQQQQQQQARRR